jgi:pyruvate dehydrogenase E1 component alpha subunit/2-oxoisovalerate dehydrogenase E1 component alpha subunit
MAEAPSVETRREDGLELWSAMCLHRAAEERLEILQRQGHITGSVYRALGQEAGCVGAATPLRRRDDGTGDILAQTVRAAGALFLFGGSLEDFFRQYMAKGTGPTRGRESNVHWTDLEKGFLGPVSPLGTMLEVMSGITLSFRLRGQDRVGMVFYGDGATSTGAWHEGISFAAAQRCPLVVVVEANEYAFSTHVSRTSRLESFTAKAPGYGIGAEAVDGTDVLAVHEAAARAVERARAGEGVQMVELQYFRRSGHAQHDPQDYVPAELLAEWEARDPLDRFRRRAVEEGWADEAELDERRSRSEERCRAAAEAVIDEPFPVGETALEDVYSDLPTRPPWTRRDPVDPRAA